ncbi:MAG: DsbA family protein [Rhodospirillaceae bacterium]|nr:DsbA family protein [Rhodospirillaceae bacterium]MBT3908478.1 DsbA family protein [Rhodospirillaceae bacterium]MBT5300524.1 DsbA family protein [Rhodospirillaceae bacterium]MBT5515696.1 DsbA family protein [Rhodospirillaceae bacterium]MBT6087125.1 DsbA family protein [Rhodospirillaceae bacterium]
MSRHLLKDAFAALNRRTFVSTALAGLAVVAVAATPIQTRADIATFEGATKEMVVGNADAPLTIIEYASLGCPHCANFHHDVYPSLKKDYIDTGKAKLVFRDFPLGTPALAATMIARCGGPKRYFGFIDIFFRAQAQWSRSENPLEALTKTARFGGMSADDVNACIRNQKLLDHVQAAKKTAFEKDGVNATPYFVIGSHKQSGGLPYDDFKKIVESELAKVN